MLVFSVITCTFNAADCLKTTLDSVARQSYPHIEHIIIDGVSKDNTMAMVGRYADEQKKGKNEHKVVAFSERDKGLYDAMNKGIAKANGDYIIFLNAGDAFAFDTTLASVARLLDSNNQLPGVIYGDTDIVDAQGAFLHKRRLSPPKQLTWRSFKQGMLVCHQSFYARTSVAKGVKYDLSYRFSADVDWCIRIMKECEKQSLTLLNTQLTLTSYLDGGMSVKNHRASLLERFNVMKTHYGLFTTLMMHLWFVVRAVIGKK